MPLTCPTCGRAIAPANISMQTSIAKCACGEVFGFDAQPFGVGVATAAPAMATVVQPEDFTVSHAGGNLVLRRRWFSAGTLILVGFFIVWIGLGAHALLTQGIMQPKVVVFIAVSFLLSYVSLAMMLNSTEIRANERTVSVQIAPIPWYGNKTIRSGCVNRFFIEQQLGYRPNGRGSSNTYMKYKVMAAMKNGEYVLLVSFYNNHNRAEYVKQQLSQHLGLVDGPRPAGGGSPDDI